MRVMFTELGPGWHESAEWHATLDPATHIGGKGKTKLEALQDYLQRNHGVFAEVEIESVQNAICEHSKMP